MQTINAHELTPKLILERYEKYDIGQIPYAVVNQGGEARAVPAQVYDSFDKKKQKETDNEIRKAVLKMVQENNVEQISRLTNQMYDYLLKTEESENTEWNNRATWVFTANKLNFLLFLLDLPKQEAHQLLTRLMEHSLDLQGQRNFVQMLGVGADEINPLYDVVLKAFGTNLNNK